MLARPTLFVFALWAAYCAVLFSVVHLTALWTVWGGRDVRRSLLLSLAAGVAATIAVNPFAAFVQPETLPNLAVSISGSWLAVALAAAVMRTWGWRFADANMPFDAYGGTREGQYGLRHLLVVTTALALWLAALRWVYIAGNNTALEARLGTRNSLFVIVMTILNAPQVLISAVTIGRGRRVVLGLFAVLSLSAVGLLVIVAMYSDRSDFGFVLPSYVSYTFANDLTQFCAIGVGMRWLRRRGYRLERSKRATTSPTTDAEQRAGRYE